MGKRKPNARFEELFKQAEQQWGWGFRTKMAKAMETTSATILNWKKGLHEPSQLQMDALSRALGNDKYPSREETIIVAEEDPRKRNKGGALREILINAREAKDAVRAVLNMVTAPIIAFAQGGEGAYPEDMEHDAPRIAVPCKDANCYVLSLEGDSMEPVYIAGDLLVVSPNMEPRPGDLVIVKTTEGQVFFKEYRKPRNVPEDVFQFVSLNAKHPPVYLRADEIFRVSVVHSVIKPLKEKVRAMTVSESAIL